MKARTNTQLKQQLQDRGMTIRLLSRVSGVAYATVYNLLTGKKHVCDASAETVRKLSQALDMSMDELYDALSPESGNHEHRNPIRDFTLMWRDEPVADLLISENNIILERYTLNPAKQIFYADRLSMYELGEILRSRCWEEQRPDISDLLHLIGLEDYNPYAIVSKTHGLMAQDPIWIRFKGEKLTYREVRRINIAADNND